MEAKDTVMSNSAILTAIGKKHYERFTIEEVAEAQAKISFKAGIREVVEWVKANALYINPENQMWQAKLKEWNVS